MVDSFKDFIKDEDAQNKFAKWSGFILATETAQT